MEPLNLSVSDLIQHVVTLGLDIYPPIDIPNERTRLNMFYEEAQRQWPQLFEELRASDTAFKITKQFRRHDAISSPGLEVETFVLTHRGPVFKFPLILPDPVNHTGLEEHHLADFDRLRNLFFAALPNRRIMRLGLLRELLFETGNDECKALLTDKSSFANAPLIGGKLIYAYRDTKHNHQIIVEPMNITRTTRLAVGATVNEHAGFGVHVLLDVNNADVQQPLQDADIQEILDRATSLWPETLLEYLRDLPTRSAS